MNNRGLAHEISRRCPKVGSSGFVVAGRGTEGQTVGVNEQIKLTH